MTNKQATRPYKLTRKQKAFADTLINEPKLSATEAANRAYNLANRKVASVVAAENLAKPSILAYMQEQAPKAESKIIELINSKREDIALRASQDLLDRVHGRAVAKVETTSRSLNISIDLSQAPDVIDAE